MHIRLRVLWAYLAWYVTFGVATASDIESRTVTVWSWPLSDTEPQPLATLSYQILPLSPVALASNASIISYTPPQISFAQEDRVRIGLYEPKASKWTGVVTSAASFAPEYNHKITLHTDAEGEVYHVGFSAFSKPQPKRRSKKTSTKAPRAKSTKRPAKSTKATQKSGKQEIDEPLVLAIQPIAPAPQPHLNKPVVLDAEGKNPSDQPEEKSFLQKYWWAIALFFVFQLLIGGGGQKEDGK